MAKKPPIKKKVNGGKSTQIKAETRAELYNYELSKSGKKYLSNTDKVLKAMDITNQRRKANDAFNFKNKPPEGVSEKVFKAHKAVGDQKRNIRNERYSNYKTKK